MNKKRGWIAIVLLIVILGAVNAAWILNYSATITTNVISEERTFAFSHTFKDDLNVDTTNEANSTTTYWEIEDLEEDLNVTFDVNTERTNLTSEGICSIEKNYEDDCRVIITHIYNNETGEVRDILVEKQNKNSKGNFILFEDISNIIEYRIECVHNSCPQEIVSEIEIEETMETFPED